ncbi:MAG: SDR family NAD(P)-dependent oxidoreductase, partial [Eubacteriales bacterium]|nr:SDR family NAD(P)-dependent oxidoreductase [Eubacteriales bacterium]
MLALVTGASSGIGRETALYLAEKGYDLILTARNEERLRELAERIESSTKACRVRVIPADLSKREECLRLWR